MKRWVALCAVLAVFVVGIVVGVLSTHLFYAHQLRNPQQLGALGARLFTDSLERRLDLNPEQKREIEQIVRQSRQEAQVLRQETLPRVLDLVERTADRIEEVLTPEQRAEFERLRRRHRKIVEHFLLGR